MGAINHCEGVTLSLPACSGRPAKAGVKSFDAILLVVRETHSSNAVGSLT